MLSPHPKAGVLPFSRSLRGRGAFSRHRGGGPPDTRQAAHDDALSSEINLDRRFFPGGIVPGTAPRPILRTHDQPAWQHERRRSRLHWQPATLDSLRSCSAGATTLRDISRSVRAKFPPWEISADYGGSDMPSPELRTRDREARCRSPENRFRPRYTGRHSRGR
jgi:hypothetical protein